MWVHVPGETSRKVVTDGVLNTGSCHQALQCGIYTDITMIVIDFDKCYVCRISVLVMVKWAKICGIFPTHPELVMLV